MDHNHSIFDGVHTYIKKILPLCNFLKCTVAVVAVVAVVVVAAVAVVAV
jgi:hypothetical protein